MSSSSLIPLCSFSKAAYIVEPAMQSISAAHDLSTWPNTASLELCALSCSGSLGCQAFSLDNSGLCTLKSGTPTLAPAASTVSSGYLFATQGFSAGTYSICVDLVAGSPVAGSFANVGSFKVGQCKTTKIVTHTMSRFRSPAAYFSQEARLCFLPCSLWLAPLPAT